MGLGAGELRAIGQSGMANNAAFAGNFVNKLMTADKDDNGQVDGSLFNAASFNDPNKVNKDYSNLVNLMSSTATDAEKQTAEKNFVNEITDSNNLKDGQPAVKAQIKMSQDELQTYYDDYKKDHHETNEQAKNDTALKNFLDSMDDGTLNNSINDFWNSLTSQSSTDTSNNTDTTNSNSTSSNVDSTDSSNTNNFGSLTNRVKPTSGNDGNISSGTTPGKGMSSAIAGTYGGVTLTQEQVNNAKTISDVGKQMGASDRDIETAIATAMQESSLQNINYGDRDSVGLFQQRPSCGWGTVEQCEDPQYAAKKFYESLFQVKNRDSMSITQAAQAVQRSAFPDAYQKYANMAAALVDTKDKA